MSTNGQISFFAQLLEEKDFGKQDTDKLMEQFKGLNTKSASAWIDKAMSLPKLAAENVELTPPTF